MKANVNISYSKNYPQEPPHLDYMGPRYDNTIDFVLAADVFEPVKKENWNNTFSTTSLLLIIMEMVKDKRPVDDDLVFDEFEKSLITICRSSLPGIPEQVKKDLVYFGVRMESKADSNKRRCTGVGYSNGGRTASHDFSVADRKFQEQMEGFNKFVELSAKASPAQLTRIDDIMFAKYLLQYLEDELPIFKFGEIHSTLKKVVEVVTRVDPSSEDSVALQESFRAYSSRLNRDKLLDAETDFVRVVEGDFAFHHYQHEARNPPSLEVLKRIMMELENLKSYLSTLSDGTIYVVCSESNSLLWKVLMIPSTGTPYYGGCFEVSQFSGFFTFILIFGNLCLGVLGHKDKTLGR